MKQLITFITIFLFSFAAMAQSSMKPCMPKKEMRSGLNKTFKEFTLGFGLSTPQPRIPSRVYELFVAEDDSWTLIRTNIRGTSCIVDSGGSWTTVVRKKGKKL